MARERPFHQQVMEAGFGDRLSQNGFEKVSPVFYRRVYPLYEVHVTVSHGYPKQNGPRSFSECTGLFFPQLRQVWDSYSQDDEGRPHYLNNLWEISMRNRTASCHIYWEVANLPVDACRLESMTEKALEKYKRQTDYWFFKPEPTIYRLHQAHLDIGPSPKFGAWAVRENRPLDDFTEEFGGYWQHLFDSIANGFQDLEALQQWVLLNRIVSVIDFYPVNQAMM